MFFDKKEKEYFVRLPWGVSRPWTAPGYSPQRWLEGAPDRRQWPAGAAIKRPFILPIPGSPTTTTTSPIVRNQLTNAAAAMADDKEEKKDILRVVHVGAFVILAISSIGSMILSYKMYSDKRREGKNALESALNEPIPTKD